MCQQLYQYSHMLILQGRPKSQHQLQQQMLFKWLAWWQLRGRCFCNHPGSKHNQYCLQHLRTLSLMLHQCSSPHKAILSLGPYQLDT